MESEAEVLDLLGQIQPLLEAGRQDELRSVATRLEVLFRRDLAPGSRDLADMLDSVAWAYNAAGDPINALRLFRDELRIRDALDPDATDVLDAVAQVGYLHAQFGELREALPFCRRWLALRRHDTTGDLATLRGNIRYVAQLEAELENYDEAERLYRELLETATEDRPALSSELASVLLQQGALQEAEKLLLPVLDAQSDEASRATTLGILGLVYDRRGQAARALPLFEESLRIREHCLSANDPDLGDAFNNVGMTRMTLGDFRGAEPLLLRAENVMAETAPPARMLAVRTNLADLYRQVGRLAEAERYAKLVVESSVALFGDEHPQTAFGLNILATVYEARGRLEDALPLMQTVLRVRRAQTPASPVDEVSAANNLGLLHASRGTYDDALTFLTAAHERAVATLGNDHPLTAFTLDNLSYVYRLCGQTELAMAAVKQALEIRRRVQGERHPDFSVSLSNLAKLLLDSRNYDEAEPLLVQAVELERATFGAEHVRYGIDLGNLGVLYKETGRYERAEELYRESLRILELAVGPRHADVGTALGNLALVRQKLGDLPGAIELLRKAADIDREALGENHPKLAIALHNLASALFDQGNYLEAQPLADRALEIIRRTLPREHPEFQTVLAQGADIQQQLGDYRSAEELMLEELELERRAVGTEHPRIAHILTALADVYREAGRLPDAARCAAEAIEILRGRGETDTARFADALSTEGLILQAQAEYARAIENLLRCREIESRVLGEDTLAYAQTLSNLATVYTETGRFSEAARFHLSALDTVKRLSGSDHPRVAISLNNLAMLRVAQGEFAEAERLLLESREIKRDTLGENGPDFALTLQNLSVVHSETGAHASARRLLEQALEITRATLANPHPLTAGTLNSLAVHHLNQRDTDAAEPLLREALRMRRQLFGDHHPEVARTLDTLGMLHLYRDELEKAEEHCRQALEILRDAFPAAHPEVARTLNNLAAIHHRRGDFAAAERLQTESLEMWRRTRGEEHPGLFIPLSNLSGLAAAQGRYDEALQWMLQLEKVNDLVILRTLPGLSEYRCMGWLETMRMTMDAFLSLVSWKFLHSAVAVRLAYGLVLRRKAVAFEVLTRQRATRAQRTRSDAELMRELMEGRQRLAEESLVDPTLDGVEAHQKKITALEASVEELEARLARSVPAVGLEQRLRRTDHAAIAAALESGTALVEFVRFEVTNFEAIAPAPISDSARYMAFLVRGGRPDDVDVIDLGDAEEIERKIDAFREWIESCSSSSDPMLDGTALREIVFDPIVRALRDCERLFIAPDGALHRLPFETLPASPGDRVLDTHQISYVVTGRDVAALAHRPRIRKTAPPLVAAAPDFDLGETGPDEYDLEPLLGAEAEGIDVASMVGVEPLLGADVLKETIERSRRPAILHLATHGFFLPDPKRPKPEVAGILLDRRSRLPGMAWFHAPPDNPLLRSGLALAGANRARKGLPVPQAAGNGLLLAMDVLHLDLAGTELVVLSACESGLGDIHASEGVYGLRRTFLLAGARTLITSLWRVPDEETRKLMVEMYRQILAGGTRSGALRAAQRFIRDDAITNHPYFWGAFICIGDGRELRLTSRMMYHGAREESRV